MSSSEIAEDPSILTPAIIYFRLVDAENTLQEKLTSITKYILTDIDWL
jgi:hypothetical protein